MAFVDCTATVQEVRAGCLLAYKDSILCTAAPDGDENHPKPLRCSNDGSLQVEGEMTIVRPVEVFGTVSIDSAVRLDAGAISELKNIAASVEQSVGSLEQKFHEMCVVLMKVFTELQLARTAGVAST